MLRSVKIPILPGQAPSVLFCLPFLGLYLPSALSQKAQPDEDVPPKYDLHLEKKSEGVVEQANLLPLGTGKDFIELIIKRGGDQVHVYVCPRPLQEELGISFSKRDEVVIAGSKAKQDESDVTFAREFVKGTFTLSFRDDEGQPQYGIRIPASEPRSRGADETFRHDWISAEEQRRKSGSLGGTRSVGL